MKMELLKLRNNRLERVGEWHHSESLLNITNQEAFNQYKHRNVSLKVTVVLVRFIVFLFATGRQTLTFLLFQMDPYIRRIRNSSGGPGSISLAGSDEIGALPLSADPFVNSNEKDTSARFEGFCIDLLNNIAKSLHFDYEIYEVQDGRFGAQDEQTGEWRGLVRELMDKVTRVWKYFESRNKNDVFFLNNQRADLAIAPLTISFARENVIDFTKPFMNLGIGILFKMPTSTPTRLFSFMSPLAVDIWLYVVAAYVLVSSTLFIVARFSPYEWTNPHPCIRVRLTFLT